MKRLLIFTSCVVVAAITMLTAGGAAAAEIAIVDINAQTNNLVQSDPPENQPADPVTVDLGPGTYTVTPIDRHLVGGYDSWNAWWDTTHPVEGCTSDPGQPDDGTDCEYGWLNEFFYSAPGLSGSPIGAGSTHGPGGSYFATEGQAFANAIGSVFTLPDAEIVSFGFIDSPMADNTGGMSLEIDSNNGSIVPEPATMTLLLSGLAGLVYARRKQRQC